MPISVCVGLAIMTSLSITVYSVKYYQILQLSHYDIEKYASWLFSRGYRNIIVGCVIAALFFTGEALGLKTLIFAPVVAAAGFFISYKATCITCLKMTKRMLRLMALCTLSVAAACFACIYFEHRAMSYITLAAFPIILAIMSLAISPFERMNTQKYLKRAKRKLGRIAPLKIAVTGSYGKTTAKNILEAMLRSRYRVCATPHSYNTPVGISVAINDCLGENDEIFIAEMGARKKGDIAFLTRAVMPEIAVITAVGNQHLETFGSVENIRRAKAELIENLPCGGRAYFCGDNDIVRQMYDDYSGNKVLTGEGGEVRCENVVMTVKGLEFDLIARGRRQRMKTKLLGRHIPSMICLCAAVALDVGVSLTEVKNAVFSLQPVAHRLQMLYNGNDVIIDDSFSSNEEGFKSAIEVLGKFSYLIKVIITPGVVELGDAQRETNRRLGEYAGRVCDYVIAVGKNAEAIREGAEKAGLGARNVMVAATRAEAMEQYKKLRGSKAVLFENDLPDNYV